MSAPSPHLELSAKELEELRRLTPEEARERGYKLIASLPNEDFVHDFYSTLFAEIPRAVIWDDEDQKHRIMAAVGDVLTDGLLPAFEHLQRIRSNTSPATERDRMQPYEDFTRTLWHTYKNLTQRAARAAGLDVAFIWQTQHQFEKGITEFEANHNTSVTSWFLNYLRLQRGWQEELRLFRNEYLEHRNDGINPARFIGNYEPGWASEMFDRVWNTAFYIILLALVRKLPPYLMAVETPKSERPPDYPSRFRVAYIPGYHFAPVPRNLAEETYSSGSFQGS